MSLKLKIRRHHGGVDLPYEFHYNNINEYLWPKTEEQFRKISIDGCLLTSQIICRSTNKIGALCYIDATNSPDGAQRWELGGIYVSETFRKYGIASALCRVAIITAFADDFKRKKIPLIAHVHEFNKAPRKMLKRLGFFRNGQEIPPVTPPPNMRRNSKGEVVGHLFEYDYARISELADWLDSFSGFIKGKEGSTALEISILTFKDKKELAAELRNMP